jgi:hypothetical protein
LQRPVTSTLAIIVGLAVALACGGVQRAAGAPPEDSTAALQAMFDQLKPGDTLNLDPGTYQHSDVIYLRVPGVRINGNGATLQANDDATSEVEITADDVVLSNINLTAPQGGPRTNHHKLLVLANGARLSGITIAGSSGAGVFISGANDFRLDRVTVRDTRADGIAMFHGASNGQVNDATVERTGDDGISVVSYTDERGYGGPPCRDIVVTSPVVSGTARGMTVSGGENISFRNIQVSHTMAAGVLITSQRDPNFTSSVNGVDVSGGSVTDANTVPNYHLGAVEIYSEHAGFSVTNVTMSDLSIVDTPASAQRNITVESNSGGTLGDIAFQNIQIQQQQPALPAIYSNAERGAYTASGIMVDGQPTTVP